MPFNGSGVFQRVRNWVADATAGIKIRADYHDAEDDGFAAGLTNCIAKDGQSVITQNIPFNSKRITGLADPVNPQDAVTKASIPAIVGTISLPLTGGTITGNLTITGDLTVSGNTYLNTLTMSGKITTAGSVGAISNAGGSAALEVKGAGAGSDASYMSFHRPGSYAVNFGLGTDNRLYVGGWSLGATQYRVLTTQDIADTAGLYAGIPTYSPPNGYVTVASDGQKLLWLTGTVTLNSPAHAVGTVITFFAWGGDLNINFANGSGMHWFGPSGATAGNRVLKQYGVATVHQFAGGYWLISGNGLT